MLLYKIIDIMSKKNAESEKSIHAKHRIILNLKKADKDYKYTVTMTERNQKTRSRSFK